MADQNTKTVKVEVRVRTSTPDTNKIVEKIRREMELQFGDASSIGYVEITVD